jgi:predicted nucleotidyltransferase component of viral defense system
MQNIQANIELFHLLFLRQLEGKLDKKLYALKGGCNLRFFFKSICYSEDIDFDVAIISKTTLENKINKILASVNFKQILQGKGMQIAQANPIKQTETTQRWKLLLRTGNSTVSIPTKIEFSQRKMEAGVAYAAIDSDVIHQHRLYPIICNHYEADTAFIQKVDALINRTETQARDIFDLKWLLDQGVNANLNHFSKQEIQSAIENIHGMKYSDFKGQVVAYLMEEYKEFYDSAKIWDGICTQVVTALQGIK